MASEEELVARKGRVRQRYDDERRRLVAGCVPYRRVGGELEVLMVSTPNRGDLVFPKGGWEDDEDVYQAACREALEEAGVKGNINRASLGLWVFRSKSSQKSESGGGGACKGYIFALEVTEELERWPEQDTHGRRWVSPEDAFRLCRYDWMREALAALLDRMMPPAVRPAAAPSLAATTALPPAPEPPGELAAGMYSMVLTAAVADRASVALC